MPDRSRGGSGIGLTLTRQILELHGGTIEARSPGRGAGSEFVVRLPLAPASVVETVSASDRAATPKRRVLVVDDDHDVAESMVALLVELGHDARAAHDGPSAILAAAEQRPEVALLDLALPGMTGFDLAPLLRRIEGLAGLSLVALSGFGNEAAREKTQLSGFDGHLLKPIDRETLEGVLRRAMPARP
jgi:CheY-like chemotaxis protein